MTDDLIPFLRARLEDEERVARAANLSGRWRDSGDDGIGIGSCSIYREEWEHLIRWDPARVLAEVEKNRQILALHYQTELESEPDHDPMGAGCAECGHFDYPCETLRLLVQPYAQHPAFRPEWSIP